MSLYRYSGVSLTAARPLLRLISRFRGAGCGVREGYGFPVENQFYEVRFAHGPMAPRMDGGIIDESERGVCSFSGKIGLSLYRYSWVSLITARHCTVTFETSWFVIRGSGRIWFSCGKPIYIVRCAHGPLALRGDRGRSDENDGGVCSFSEKIGLSLYRFSGVSKPRHATVDSHIEISGCGGRGGYGFPVENQFYEVRFAHGPPALGDISILSVRAVRNFLCLRYTDNTYCTLIIA